MGRNYRTAKATFVEDNIYTPPWELMAKVIGNADSQIEKNETALLSLYDKLEAQSLSVDEPRLKEIIGGYQGRIEELAQKITKNPLEFRRDMGAIRGLGRDIHNDWTKGEVSAIQGNKQAYDGWVKKHLEKVKAKKGYVTQDDMTYAKSKFLSDFGGTNYDNGNYDNIVLEDLNPYVNVEDLGEERAKGYIADVIAQHGAYTDGKYMYTSENKKEFVPFNTIKKGVLSSMMNDKELMSYYSQQVRLGRMNQTDVASKIEAAANRVAEKYSYTKKEAGKTSIKANPFALEAYKQKNRMSLINYKDKLKSAGLITGPGENAVWATKEQQLEWDLQTIQRLKKLADNTKVNITSTDPIKAIQEMKEQYNKRLLAAKRTGKSQKVIDAVQNQINQLDKIDGLHNDGKGVASWTGMAEAIDAITNNQNDGTKIAANTKKALESYAKNGTMNNVEFYMEEDGKMVKTTINDLIEQGKIANEKDVVITNSFMPTWNNMNPNKQELNQVDFKIKLKTGEEYDETGKKVYTTKVVPVKSTFKDFELNFYE